MVNREVNSIVVRAMATMAIRLRVRLVSRLFHAKWRTHFRLKTFMPLPPYCATIRPSSMRTIRSESWAISSLCVIMTIVWENFRPVTFIRPQYILAGAAVQVSGRFVGQEDGGFGCQGAGDGHPLLLARRKAVPAGCSASFPAPGGDDLAHIPLIYLAPSNWMAERCFPAPSAPAQG